MVTLRLASESELDELRAFRSKIYGAELGIQEEGYQDVFNDYLSKNVVLRSNGRLVGAIRLAFSRETQEFYISYLSIELDKRNRGHLRLLLGGVFLLMKVNKIRRVRADAADGNLAMYLNAGCKVVGPKFRKYGFTCEWTPLTYRLGTHPRSEDRLIRMARKHLDEDDAHWKFCPRLLLCGDTERYRQELDRLIAARLIPGIIPHVGSNCEYLSLLKSPWLESPTILRSADVPTSSDTSFDRLNKCFNPRNLILVRRNSQLSALAKNYSVLCGKLLVEVDDWQDFRLHESTEARSVFLIVDAFEVSDALAFIYGLAPHVISGIATGPTVEAVSWFLLMNYFRFVGPGESGCDNDAFQKRHPRLTTASLESFTGPANGDLAPTPLAAGPASSHIVLTAEDCPDEALLLLSCLCEAGYSTGDALRYVNAAFQSELHSADCRRPLSLLGDPNLRLHPLRPSEVRSQLDLTRENWRVVFKNTGRKLRLYHFQTTGKFPSPILDSGGDGIHCRAFHNGSAQHLFAFATMPLPNSLAVPLTRPKDF